MRITLATSLMVRVTSVSIFILAASMMVACSDNKAFSSAEKISSYESYDDLPNCTKKHEGEVLKVDEDNSNYTCTDGRWEKNASPDDINLPKNIKNYETEEDLPKCTSKNKSAKVFVEADSVVQICQDNKWQTLGTPIETEDDILNCTKKREGQSIYLLDENSVLTCEDGEWVASNIIIEDDDEENSSDSKSSNSTGKSSSSSKEDDPPAAGLSLKTLIYDSDQLVNPLFTSYGETTEYEYDACTGVRTGIVKTNLSSDRKPQFNTGNSNATLCAGTDSVFNTLFNYTENVNEISRYDLPVEQNETTGMYFFDSDSVLINDLAGGFFPIDDKTDRDIRKELSPQFCPTCRTKRTSEKSPKWGRDETTYTLDEDGYPVYITIPGPGIDYKYCSGPGWEGGIDCGGICYISEYDSIYNSQCFDSGDFPNVWDWGAPRWEELRNHHFCMELNGQFTYQAKQEAKFYAGGDLWVFVNGKLAVDLGGNHLPAPGYIDMATLNSYYDGYMQTGKTYPIDVFFCARRTTISTFAMYTNFRITQN